MEMPVYSEIVEFVQTQFRLHGDSHEGLGWPKPQDMPLRFDALLDVIRPSDGEPVSILDFGCGAGHLLDHIQERQIPIAAYTGIDIAPSFVELCRAKYPDWEFACVDVLQDPTFAVSADYVIMNGILTYKGSLSFEQMVTYWQDLLTRVYGFARRGLVFNVMSKIVDWERDDLFHLSFDRAADFVGRQLSRNFVFRHDYRLYEYMVYVYR
jgi:SAM-dependent methyltransferase